MQQRRYIFGSYLLEVADLNKVKPLYSSPEPERFHLLILRVQYKTKQISIAPLVASESEALGAWRTSGH